MNSLVTFAAVIDRIGFVFLFLLISIGAFSQITDDSSKLVYGPATTRIIYERDLKDNLPVGEHELDTSLFELENFVAYDRLNRAYQDLGNNGTAISPIFPLLPSTIGKTSGFHSYDYYFKQPKDFRYYNTRSPFMDVRAAFGSQGRSTVDFSYSANVNPTWNVGIDLSRITTDKQIGAEQTQGDANVRNTLYDIYTYYQHPDRPYKLMFNFVGFTHKVDETGGVLVLSEAPLESEFFQYRDSDIQLEDAVSEANYSNVHLFHEYALFDQFQVYHQLDRGRRVNRYSDFQDAVSGGYDTYRDFYSNFLFDTDTTYEEARFREFSNEVGLKGTLSSVFYRFYVRRRDVDLSYLLLELPAEGENYLGGVTRFDWRDFRVEGKAEFLSTGELMLQGQLQSELVEASYTTIRYKPTYLTDRYFGNHNEWRNNFSQGFSNHLTGGLNLELGPVAFHPRAELLNMDDFFYFDQNVVASQAVGSALITRLGGNLNFFFKTNSEGVSGFHFNNQFYYSTTSGDASELIRIPELFYNGRYYWKGKIFQKSVPVEIGINAHSKSSYFGNAYDPATQQFYLQDDFQIDQFLAMDFFINMRIDKIFAFLKVTHFNQAPNSGYFVTPYYPGQNRVFDFGVRWLFFD